MSLHVRSAVHEDCYRISQIASATFALACPANTPAEEIEQYIQSNLLPVHFEALLGDGQKQLRVVLKGTQIVGYSLITLDPEPLGIAVADNVAELTRCYLSPDHHGTGAAQALLDGTLRGIEQSVRLTVNETNDRAIRFYQRNGFDIVGETRFVCGADVHRDWVMLRQASRG